MSTERNVFYRLVTRDGLPYADTDADFVMCSSNETIMSLVKMVHAMNSAILSWCTSAQLKVHPDISSLSSPNGALLKESALGESHGNDIAQPLLVLVPSDGPKTKRQRQALDERLNSKPCLPPDSQRVDELLPSKTYVEISHGRNLHFVNREEAMLRLLDVHCEHFWRRSEGMGSGDNIKFPLIDNLFGMGKTRFCRNYLALVERYISQKREQFGNEERAIEAVASDLSGVTSPNGQRLSSSSSEVGTPTVGEKVNSHASLARMSEKLEMQDDEPGLLYEKYAHLKGLLGALHEARTLYVKLGLNSLVGDSWETKFADCVKDALHMQWRVNVPEKIDWRKCLKYYIQKPVFFVFDEIGRAFGGESEEIAFQRKKFFTFVEQICEPISEQEGMFYVLSGRAKFLWTVGVRSEDDKSGFSGSPGEFARIHLNPIRECYIEQILEKTYFKDGERLIDSVRKNLGSHETIESFIGNLYAKTGGHPRTMSGQLFALGKSLSFDTSFMARDVQTAIDLYPRSIKRLFDMRNSPNIDITIDSPEMADKPASLHYLAGRIHAGYGINLERTKLLLPPPVERFLCFRFLPFLEYLDRYKSIIGKISIDRSRVFEEVLIKWFQSVFTDKTKTIEGVLGEFCPQNTMFSKICLFVDPSKCKDGPSILPGEYNSKSETTVSMKEFGSQMSDHLTNGDLHIYFPYERSVSPDFFVVQSTSDFIIGVQAKCLTGGTISADACIVEAGKLYANLECMRKIKPGIRGTLLMCATTEYTLKDFPALEGSKAVSWGRQKIEEKKWEGFEIIIINLSSESRREEFFRIAMPRISSECSAAALDVIERIIRPKSKRMLRSLRRERV